MYHKKRNWFRFKCLQQTAMDYYKVIYAMLWFLASDFFRITKLKKMSNISFMGDF